MQRIQKAWNRVGETFKNFHGIRALQRFRILNGGFRYLDGFIEDPTYEVFKEENMDFEALENMCMEE